MFNPATVEGFREPLVSCRPAAPHSSRGLGHRPLKAEITGSNPVCGTKSHITGPDPRRDRAFVCLHRAGEVRGFRQASRMPTVGPIAASWDARGWEPVVSASRPLELPLTKA